MHVITGLGFLGFVASSASISGAHSEVVDHTEKLMRRTQETHKSEGNFKHIARHDPFIAAVYDGLVHHATGHGVLLTDHDIPQTPQDATLNQTVPATVGASGHFDSRAWCAVLVVPFLLWVAFSDKTAPPLMVSCYVGTSLSMTVLNKLAVSTFKSTYLLVIIQMLIAIIVIIAVEHSRMKCGNWMDLVRWMIVPLAFAGMLSTSMLSLNAATISAVLITRNLLPVISFAAEKALFNDPPSVVASMITSLVVSFVGTLLYAATDMSLSKVGMIYIVANCFLTLLDRLAQTYYLKKSPDFSLSVPTCMVLNNAVGAFLLVLVSAANGDLWKAPEILRNTSSATYFWVVMSSLCGACLGYVGLRTQKLVSGTTILVLQNGNKMLLLVLGYAIFGDRLGRLAWAGCFVSMAGCCWYSATRLPQEIKPEKK